MRKYLTIGNIIKNSLQSEQWSDLNLKSKNVTENKFTYDHVHQVQRLEEGTDYELTIESRNNYGWSQPLTVKFTTLGQGNSNVS